MLTKASLVQNGVMLPSIRAWTFKASDETREQFNKIMRMLYILIRIWVLRTPNAGVKTFKFLRPCIAELDAFLKKPENNVIPKSWLIQNAGLAP